MPVLFNKGLIGKMANKLTDQETGQNVSSSFVLPESGLGCLLHSNSGPEWC
jgi:hypothetical protein